MSAKQGVVALTGATGFVGKVTLDRLLEAGWQVRALTRRDQPKRTGVTWVRGSLGNTDSLQHLCEGAGAVLNIAGVVNAPDAAGFEAGNVTQLSDAAINVVFTVPGQSATLTINAANNIHLDGGITSANGELNVALNANVGSDDLNSDVGDVERRDR